MKRKAFTLLNFLSLIAFTFALNFEVAFADGSTSNDDFTKARLLVTCVLILIALVFLLTDRVYRKYKDRFKRK